MNSRWTVLTLCRPGRLLCWALIVVVMLAVAALLSACDGHSDEPWQPTPTFTVPPTATEALPSPTPTEWYEGIVTATPLPPTPTPPRPVTWTLTAVNAEGYGNVPQEIDDWIWESFVAALGCYVIQDPNTPGPGWPAVEIPPDNMAVFEEAVRHLPEDYNIIYNACEAYTHAEILNPARAPMTAEFGPRIPAVCDTPTHCYVGVTLRVTGLVIYDEEFCQRFNLGSPPVHSRISMPPYEFVFIKALMEYDEETGIWMMTEYERHDLEP